MRKYFTFSTLSAQAPGRAQIEVQVVDQAGNPVPDAAPEVTVTPTGPARLLGLESGDLASHEPCAAPRHRAHQGRLLLYVQATGAGPLGGALGAPGPAGQAVALRPK